MTFIPASLEPASSAKRVYVIDDDREVRKSIHFLLGTANIVAWPFGDGEDFIANAPDLEPAPILLDIRMPGMDGFGVIARLAALDIFWPIIALSAHGDVPVAVRAMKQGVVDFIEKPFLAEELEAAIARAFDLLSANREGWDRQATARRKLRSLTPREEQITRELVTGAANKVVAHRLALSTRTIEMHRARAMGKLGLKSLAEAASLIALANESPPLA